MSIDDLREKVLKFAVHNAFTHNGKAQKGPIIGRILGSDPEFRDRIKEIAKIIDETLLEVNSWNLEEQAQMINEKWPELLVTRKKEEKKKTLPPLENVDKYEVIKTRFAPNPDGALHLGSAEPIIFCDEYAKMYDGKFILRYEDTSPDVKAPILEIYNWIREDLDWLNVKVDEVYMQSDRLQIYYEYAEKLININAAYVCTCDPTTFKNLYMAKKACPCRGHPPKTQLERWEKMLDGTYKKGDAVVRIKTDLSHPNPAIRDWPALRIAEGIHPRQGDKFRVWPLYNFSCAIDDHLMKVSHIIRGKEHEVNTTRQRYISEYLDWVYPEIINIGRLGLEAGILSKSRIRKGIDEGIYSDWDDPRLGTLRALRKRGLQPETIREIMIQVGPKPINATLSWDQIASVNRRLIEPKAKRYFFVKDPTNLLVKGLSESYTAKLPKHPDHTDWGARIYKIDTRSGEASFIVSADDFSTIKASGMVRLMGLFNIKISSYEKEGLVANFHTKSHQEAREIDIPFIHWLPVGTGVKARVFMPDATISEGIVEKECSTLSENDMIQFERFGFVRVDKTSPFVAFYAHR
jgi:glutamyl-tRNA synthetase